MAVIPLGSLTKEFPLDQVDRTLRLIRSGMTYARFRQLAIRRTSGLIPGLLVKRYLLVRGGRIVYDRFLSLVATEDLPSARTRKIMHFIWAYRDRRIRQFILKVIANSNGKWRASELKKKRNARFFQRFFQPGTARKVRSNFEYFLKEAGIFDPRTNRVHLELNDGWVIDAVQVAAQHEIDRARRRAMATEPIDFLISNGLHGLANATIEELRALDAIVPDPQPTEDEEIGAVGPSRSSVSKPWNWRKPTPAHARAARTQINLVARERANMAHWRLGKLLRDAAAKAGYRPRQHEQIDLHFRTGARSVLAEVKSCVAGNLHSQIRRGVAQLLEYRFLFSHVVGDPNPVLALILELPPEARMWLVDYLRSIGIVLVWKDPAADRLVSTRAVPAPLRYVVSHS